MRKFGLIGKNISYSFSKNYFENKFKNEDLKNTYYENFDISSLDELESIFRNNPDLCGLNVTIPYKERIIPYLDSINKKAKEIGAVNTIKIGKKGNLKGYNTDYYGFSKSLKPHLKSIHKRALVLGTGGASKAIAFALKKLEIECQFVSRKPSEKAHYTYRALTKNIIDTHLLIVNCTPLGTFPKIEECPDIPYKFLSNDHILFDLIYNPIQSRFLKLGANQNALTINGSDMLKYQAQKSWTIWNNK